MALMFISNRSKASPILLTWLIMIGWLLCSHRFCAGQSPIGINIPSAYSLFDYEWVNSNTVVGLLYSNSHQYLTFKSTFNSGRGKSNLRLTPLKRNSQQLILYPSLSPDGKGILYSVGSLSQNLNYESFNGDKKLTWKFTPCEVANFSWLEDGRRFVSIEYVDSVMSIVVRNIDNYQQSKIIKIPDVHINQLSGRNSNSEINLISARTAHTYDALPTIRYQSISLLQDNHRTKTALFKVPNDGDIWHIIPSPNGKIIAILASEMHVIRPRVDHNMRKISTLRHQRIWTFNLETNYLEMHFEKVFHGFRDELRTIKWKPDGQSLSYVIAGKMFVLPLKYF